MHNRFMCWIWTFICAAVGIALVYALVAVPQLTVWYMSFVGALELLRIKFVALTVSSVLLVPFVWHFNKVLKFKLRRMWHLWSACHGEKGSCQACKSLCDHHCGK